MPIILDGTTGITTPGITNTGTFVFQGPVQVPAGSAATASITTAAGANTGIFFPSSSSVAITTAGTQRFVVSASGDVGIGTSSPSQKLEVAGAAKLTGTNLAIVPSTTTSAAYLVNTNAGGNFFLGIDNSTGGSFGAGAYGRILYSGGAYPIAFFTNDTERMRLDSSGNLGLGVTPSAWSSTLIKAIQIGDNNGSISSYTTGNTSADWLFLNNNAYYDAAGWKYIASSTAAQYAMTANEHRWYNAPSGTAGNAISFTQAMTLDASGRLGIGTTSPGSRVQAVSADNTNTTVIGSFDAANQTQRIQIGFQSIAQYSASDPIRFLYNGLGGTEICRMTSDGRVGIGTTSPASILDVRFAAGTTGSIVNIANSSSAAAGNIVPIRFFTGNTFGGLEQCAAIWGINPNAGTNNGGALVFATSANGTATTPSERARIHAAGGVTIGGTTANGMLNVISTQSNTNPTANFIHNASGAGQAYAYVTGASDAFHGIIFRGVPSTSTSGTDYSANPGDQMSFIEYGGDFRFYTKQPSVLNFNAQILGGNMTITGTLTQSGTPSDISLKQNVRKLNNALPKILALEGVSFEWKEGSKERDMVGLTQDYGFIAQDVEKIVPEIVGRRPNDNLASLRYNGITALLVEAIKELKAELDALKGSN